MKTLLVMRHAKSDWETDYGADHDRPLNHRGAHGARLMGRVIASRDQIPDLVVSSTAVRARTTAELAIEAGEWGSQLRLDRLLYESGVDEVLGVAAGAPEVGTLMLVGHQPTWSMLVMALTGNRVEMRTASIAIVELEIGRWEEITGGRGSLVEILEPKQFLGSEWDLSH